MTLTLYNTAARSLQPFDPLEPGKVRVYACGPTIYDHAHIGNFRTFLFFDLVHRYLEWSGYEVRFVMNLTDVDDKTIRGAREEGVDVRSFTEPFGEAVLHDARVLGVRPVDAYPRATEYVGPMIDRRLHAQERGPRRPGRVHQGRRAGLRALEEGHPR
jgi:cysteinyl-tRNA synthetase